MALATDRSAVIFGVCLSLALVSAPGRAGGFAVHSQSARAMGLGGAFTAQTDGDPSSLFYNVAGAAFIQEKTFAIGAVGPATWDVTFDSLPTVGIGTQFEQSSPSVLPHGFTVLPLKPYLKFGLAVVSPFAFESTWKNPGAFPGRTESFSAELQTLDINPSLAIRFDNGFGIGFGAIYRTTKINQARRLQTTDPQSGATVDFATLGYDSGMEDGFGFNAGIAQKVSEQFSWGLSYRSAVDVDYGGSSLLTQIPTGNDQLDSLLALSNPFDQNLGAITTLEFPESASAGITLGSAQRFQLSLDVDWTAWTSLQSLTIDVPAFPAFDQTIDEQFDDSLAYRIGVQVKLGNNEYRLGYAFDESPQPDATVGPFFYDANRNIVSFGFGRDWLDIGAQWISYEDRNAPTLEGVFQGQTVLVGVTIRKRPKP